MPLGTIILLAFALSIDASVVSFSYGLNYNHKRLRNSLLLSSFTGIFQGLMPAIAYFLTGFVKTYIQPYAKIIIFSIFLYLGVKFIFDSFKKNKKKKLFIDLKSLILIGIATSIDAFSAGISLLLSGNGILYPAILIMFVTFVNASLGFYAGVKLRHFPAKILEVIAGMLLILIAVKALV